ncbi:hypothetical protein PR048_020163 [Dryococelus australis]|uniref:Uncharacterized protein n=1 Tax=Dryococelus australis TaxID=614101 RepID=A0ABQ9H5H9_9NEOP|nr:hypothetical protein PR048_020163 [Dryococelus australis]
MNHTVHNSTSVTLFETLTCQRSIQLDKTCIPQLPDACDENGPLVLVTTNPVSQLWTNMSYKLINLYWGPYGEQSYRTSERMERHSVRMANMDQSHLINTHSVFQLYCKSVFVRMHVASPPAESGHIFQEPITAAATDCTPRSLATAKGQQKRIRGSEPGYADRGESVRISGHVTPAFVSYKPLSLTPFR